MTQEPAAMAGRILQGLRQQRGLTQPGAAAELNWAQSKISRLERGQIRMQVADLDKLLNLYKITEPVAREYLHRLSRGDICSGWWDVEPRLPVWARARFSLEAAAEQIRAYQPTTIPALLQHEEYARALSWIVKGPWARPEQVERRVEIIMRRRELLDRTDPPVHLWAIVNQSALRTPVGSLDVHVQQLETLIAATKQPHVHVQIASSRYRTLGFMLLRPPGDIDPQTLYVDDLVADRAFRDQEKIDKYLAAFMYFAQIGSQTREETVNLITSIRSDLVARNVS